LRRGRWIPIVAVAAALAAPGGLAAAGGSQSYETLRPLVAGSAKERRAAAARIAASGDPGLVPGIVDALFFVPKADRGPVFETLRVTQIRAAVRVDVTDPDIDN